MADTIQTSGETFRRYDPSLFAEEPRQDEDVEMTMEDGHRRIILAVDFGTTFSSVAYVQLDGMIQDTELDIENVKCISKYPGDRSALRDGPREDVPTELWYSLGELAGQEPSDDIPIASIEDDSDSERIAEFNFNSNSSSESESELDKETEQKEEEPRNPNTIFWGFEVQLQLQRTDQPKDGMKRVALFKLLLDEKNTLTNHIRESIKNVVRNLKKSKLIKKDTDIISDYLTQLFIQTRNELRKTPDFDDNIPIEFVLSIPAVWPSKACRIMQAAMAIGAQRSGLGHLKNENVGNLFIVSEPEAAAACVLAEHRNDIYPGETIVILDAGGGTVDAVTYQVTNSYPLRLSAEIIPPGSKVCGASYINERFEKLLQKKLQDENYLEKNGNTIGSIVEAKVIDFENGEKRLIDITDKHWKPLPVRIEYLERNPKKGFHQNRLEISRKEMKHVFGDSLIGTADLLQEQLQLAKATGPGYSVKKVLLVGGFGQSPSLQSYLRKVLSNETNLDGQNIDLLVPHTSSTVVARGAVLRAFSKELGPTRITQCSYGILLTEPYEPEICPAHKNTRYIVDKADGERYIDRTIKWLIRKGKELPTNHEFVEQTKHTFKFNWKKLICKEELYVSDGEHPNHYRKSHPMNKGAELAGSIEVDMTFLRDREYIKPKLPSEWSKFWGSDIGHWEVTFDLVMIVDGRNLRYEARWPSLKDPEADTHQQSVQAQGQICIAAAFRPGTA